MSKPFMVCIGKAGQDVFLEGDVFKPKRENGILYEHMQLGNKYYVDKATVTTGNNAVNAAVTFARQHLPVQLVTCIGDDSAGQMVLRGLDSEHIDTSLVHVDPDVRTSFSTILLSPTGERTILDFPGTAKLSERIVENVEYDKSWLYISSVGSMPLMKRIIKRAHEGGMKIAFNPASFELKHIQECADLLEYVTLFALNKEEAKLFVEGSDAKSLARALSSNVDYVLVSDGPHGSVASDSVKLVKAGMYDDVPVIDRTGAGDAFTSGFVASVARGETIEDAITFASANSTSVVQKIGANTGVLRSNADIHKMDLDVTAI